jgi:hypothetical protein
MLSDQFLIWDSEYRKGFCVIQYPDGIADDLPLSQGLPMLEGWNSDVTCQMSSEFPKDIRLSDNSYGVPLVVISKGLRDFVKSIAVDDPVEYLPVAIKNHKGRLASSDYFIVNPLKVVDCIDQAKSGVKWNKILKTQISSVDQLVLKDVPGLIESHLFRLYHMPTVILVSRKLAEAMLAEDFTGLQFGELSEYRG